MAKFNLGEEVVLILPVTEFRGGGREVLPAGTEGIVDGLPGCNFVDPRVYQIGVDGHSKSVWALEQHLRRKTGSWDEIERTTGFRPSKTRRKTPEREPEKVT